MASASPPAAETFDLNEAFAYVFRSPNWVGSVLLGALCELGSFLIVPSWILYGYAIQTSRNVRAGSRTLPAWDRVGQNIVDGFLFNVVILLWLLPIGVLVLIGVATSGCTNTTDVTGATTTSCSNVGALALFILLAALLSLFVLFAYPAIYAQYTTRGFGAAFQVSKILDRIGRRVGLTFLMIVVAILTGIVAVAGLIAFFVGVLVTAPYAQYVLAYAYGQYARLTDPPGVVTA